MSLVRASYLLGAPSFVCNLTSSFDAELKRKVRLKRGDAALEVNVSSENEELSHLACFPSLRRENADELSCVMFKEKPPPPKKAKSCKMVYFTIFLHHAGQALPEWVVSFSCMSLNQVNYSLFFFYPALANAQIGFSGFFKSQFNSTRLYVFSFKKEKHPIFSKM